MKKITLENQTIEISDESFEELKKSFIKEERFFLEDKEEYFFIDSKLEVDYCDWLRDNIDLLRLGQNNVFKTQEEAKAHAKKLHAISEITNYCWETGLAKKWVEGENNLFFNWNSEDVEFESGDDAEFKTLIVLPYLKSEEACEEVIEKFEDELKLIFEV